MTEGTRNLYLIVLVVVTWIFWETYKWVKRDKKIQKFLSSSVQFIRYTLIVKNWKFSREISLSLSEFGAITVVNEKFKKCFGYSENQIEGERMGKILSPKELSRFEEFKVLHAEKDLEEYLITECIKRDGTSFPAEINIVKEYDDIDRKIPIYIIGIRDIQHRIDGQKSFDAAKEYIDRKYKISSTAIEIMKGGGWTWDLETNNVDYDEGFRKIFNLWKGQAVTAIDLMDLVYYKDTEKVNAAMLTSSETAKPYDVQFRVPQKDGTLNLVEVRGEPILSKVNKKVIKYNGSALLLQENVI